MGVTIQKRFSVANKDRASGFFSSRNEILDASVDAFGKEDDQKNKSQTVNDLGKAHKRASIGHPEIFLQGNNQSRPDRRTPEAEHSAQNRLEGDFEGGRHPGQSMGVQIGDVLGVQYPPIAVVKALIEVMITL